MNSLQNSFTTFSINGFERERNQFPRKEPLSIKREFASAEKYHKELIFINDIA